jgi:uncharacterized protein YaiI (UPF0178 family)
MSSIYVDGDACPVKEETARVAARYALQVYIVSNQGLRNNLGPHVRGVMVGSEFDAADDWIVENIAADDIAITADIQLAARCLKKNARAINPTGKPFTEENIGSALAMRELSSYLREAGEIKGGNAPFSKQDRSTFLQSLDLIIQKTVKK